MVSSQLHYTKVNRFMPFLLAEILNFQSSTHRIGVGSFSYSFLNIMALVHEASNIREDVIEIRNLKTGFYFNKYLLFEINSL